MKIIDGANAKNAYSTVDIDRIFDSLYARSFLKMQTPGFDATLIAELQTLIDDFRQQKLSIDPVQGKLFRSYFFQDLI